MKNQNDRKPNAWITLIGFVLLLIGLYSSIRTAVNLIVFPKYPTVSVLSFGSAGFYGPREEDCMIYPPPFTDEIVATGNTSINVGLETIEEKKQLMEQKKMMEDQAKKQQEACISGAVQMREQTKVNDISQSLLFLFLGGGVLLVRKYLFV